MFGGDILFAQRFLKSLGFYTKKLDGLFGPETDKANVLFEDKYDEIADKMGRFDKRSETTIATLHPKTQELAREFLRKIQDSGILGTVTIKLISGTRNYAEQAELFAQGRTKSGKIVTNAGPGQSNHNFGIAWDVGLFKGASFLDESPLYAQIGQEGKKISALEWGGDFKTFVDRPHFQVKNSLTLKQIRAKFEKGESYLS
jgi:peptidoglycan L-alanyl-D-glutamate endopeptidase CwlK